MHIRIDALSHSLLRFFLTRYNSRSVYLHESILSISSRHTCLSFFPSSVLSHHHHHTGKCLYLLRQSIDAIWLIYLFLASFSSFLSFLCFVTVCRCIIIKESIYTFVYVLFSFSQSLNLFLSAFSSLSLSPFSISSSPFLSALWFLHFHLASCWFVGFSESACIFGHCL